MRIVIDMQGAQSGSRFRGIGRYTISFVKQFLVEAKQHEVILALNGVFSDTIEPIREEFAHFPNLRILVWQAMSRVYFLDAQNDARRRFSEGIREAFLAGLKPDVVLISSMFEGALDDAITSIGAFVPDIPTAVILYDFIPLIYEGEYLTDPQIKAVYMTKFEQLRSAQLLLAISESSRQEGIKYLNFEESSVVNILTAIDPTFSAKTGASQQELSKKFNYSRPYIMYSGASDARKNLVRLIKAYASLSNKIRQNHHLLLAGGMAQEHINAFKREILEAGLGPEEVIFTGHITDDEMVGLYRGAKGYVFPSYHEGFGLPVLEAMSFGVPVIGANTSSVPEVIGNPIALFDPWSESSICAALERLINDAGFRQELTKRALLQSKNFSWQLTAKKALAALEKKFGNVRISHSKFGAFPVDVQIDALVKFSAKILQSAPASDLLAASSAIDSTLARERVSKCLFVDVSELQRTDAKTGIQRVVRNILARLLSSPPIGYDVIPVFATLAQDYRVAKHFVRAFLGAPKTQEDDYPLEFREGDIFLGLDYNDLLISGHAAYFASLRRAGVRVYFVVYDILAQMLDDIFPAGATENQIAWLKTIAMADGLICISRAVADDVHNWLEMFGPKRQGVLQIGWFHLGADLDFVGSPEPLADDADKTLQQINSRPAFLVVSTIEPRKMQNQVVDAFEILWKDGEDINLVLVGKRGWHMDAFIHKLEMHPEKNKRLFWLESISDFYLERVYSSCTCLIAASLGEGFGLSLIEGAKHGLPVIARDIPVFQEVAGSGAHYFSSRAPSALANAVRDWRASKEGFVQKTGAMTPSLSWEQSTFQLLNAFINGYWYRKWAPDTRIRYSGADSILGTIVGRRSASGMSTTGEAGCLLFGPFISLKPGKYEALLDLTIRAACNERCRVEITINSGQLILGCIFFGCKLSEKTTARADFLLLEACLDIEIRVMVDDVIDLTVHSVELIKNS